MTDLETAARAMDQARLAAAKAWQAWLDAQASVTHAAEAYRRLRRKSQPSNQPRKPICKP